MMSEWQQFLTEQGARVSETGVVTFAGDKQLAPDNALAVQSGDVVLRVSGDDALPFLQGQFSNDVAALADPGSQLTTWSTPKGRVLALFRLYKVNDAYLIQLPAELAETFAKRLRMYVLMSKVTIEEQPDWICLGFSGELAEQLVEKSIEALPTAIDACVAADDMVVARLRGSHRLQMLARVTRVIDLWPQLTAGLILAGEDHFRLQNINAGVPVIGKSTSEAFVLQMLNLNHIDGVSFKKGCFPGQEVVARMQYLGKLKRRMYLATGSADNSDVPAAGDDLFNEDKTSAVGKVVDAQMNSDNSYRMLAVLAISATDEPLYLEPEATNRIELLELPYSVETE